MLWKGPYCFNNETGRGVHYHEMLNTHVQSEAQPFPQNVGFQEARDLSHITRNVRALLHDIFSSSWMEGHGPSGWPEISSN